MSQKIPDGKTGHLPASRALVFAALGDETRLALVVRLSGGRPHSIAQLTDGSRLTRQAITKHLRVLEGAGMVRCFRRGRESLFELNPEPIAGVREYLEAVSAQWDRALTRLKHFVEDERFGREGGVRMSSDEAVLAAAYKAFNERDMDAVLDLMHPQVDWENGATGERVVGRAALRAYWTAQWAAINPRVEPVGFRKEPDGRTLVAVHQVVRELDGKLVMDRLVEHVYALENGLILRLEIRNHR